MARPWTKWYFADWRGDPRLRMCSLAARGLWADILSYMHEGEPYGHFTIDGRVPELPDVARLVGAPVRDVREAWAELERHGVFSRTDDGVPYSRRLLKDAIRDQIQSERGKLGGNPRLKGGVNPHLKPQKLEARTKIDSNTEPDLEFVGSATAKPKKGTRWESGRLVEKDWISDAIRARQKHSLPEIDLELEAETFALFWAGVAGAKGVKLDWHKTWLNRVLSVEGKRNGISRPNGRIEDRTSATVDQILGGIAARRSAEI